MIQRTDQRRTPVRFSPNKLISTDDSKNLWKKFGRTESSDPCQEPEQYPLRVSVGVAELELTKPPPPSGRPPPRSAAVLSVLIWNRVFNTLIMTCPRFGGSRCCLRGLSGVLKVPRSISDEELIENRAEDAERERERDVLVFEG